MGLLQLSDYMVQKPPCWNANWALGHLKQSEIIYICPGWQFAFQYGGFCTMWSQAAKGLLAGKTLDSNDQRFSLKKWFAGGAQSRGLRKPGCGHCYLRLFS